MTRSRVVAGIARRTMLVAMVPSLLVGCRVGPNPATHPAATTPTGSLITIEHQTRGRVVGEILEARPDAILLLESGRVASVPFAAVRRAEFGLGTVTVRMGSSPNDGQRERLRLASRYPHGLRPELLEKLLARYGQSEVEELSP